MRITEAIGNQMREAEAVPGIKMRGATFHIISLHSRGSLENRFFFWVGEIFNVGDVI